MPFRNTSQVNRPINFTTQGGETILLSPLLLKKPPSTPETEVITDKINHKSREKNRGGQIRRSELALNNHNLLTHATYCSVDSMSV